MQQSLTRKLTTILAADAEGFSAAMDADEVATFGELSAARAVFSKLIDRHNGRIANTAGDGLIAEFPSVVEAVQCAIETQQELGTRPQGLRFRIGVHLGDVIVDGQDLIGEGVNLAARLQTMAEPGGVLISQQVYDQVHAKLRIGFEYLGERRPRNLSEDVSIYRVATGASGDSQTNHRNRPAAKPAPTPPASEPSEPTATSRFSTRQVRLAALAAAALLIVNLSTGSSLWVHWPILVAATLFALSQASLLANRASLSTTAMRGVILGCALVLVNLFTWSGYAWALWPIGVLAVITLGRRILSGSD